MKRQGYCPYYHNEWEFNELRKFFKANKVVDGSGKRADGKGKKKGKDGKSRSQSPDKRQSRKGKKGDKKGKDADAEGPKAPELQALNDAPQVAPKGKAQPKAKSRLAAGGECRVIMDEVRSLYEQVDHFRSGVERVDNTVEMKDFFGSSAKKARRAYDSSGELEKCYQLATLPLESMDKSVCSLNDMVDQLFRTNPDYGCLKSLEELDAEEYIRKKYR